MTACRRVVAFFCWLVLGALPVGCSGRVAGSVPGDAGTGGVSTGGAFSVGGQAVPKGDVATTGGSAVVTAGLGVPSNVVAGLGWSLMDDTPAGRRGVSLVFDSAADRLIALGGLTNEVWSLPLSGVDENHWVRLFPEGERPPPFEPVSVYDPVGNRVLALPNGWNDANADYDPGQLWELALTGTPRWRRLTPAGASPGRELTRGMLALDSASHRLFVLGGDLGGHGVWALALEEDGEWTRVADAPPGTQAWTVFSAGKYLVFDAARQRLVAFLDREVWELPLESGRWSSLGTDPCWRFYSTAVFDEAAERVVYTGGDCGGSWTFSLSSNEWQGRGQVWTDDSVFGASALDPRRERILLGFQGLSPVGNQIWQMPLTTLEPEPFTSNTRAAFDEGFTLVWDPVREAVLALGGQKEQTWSRALAVAGAWQALPVSANASGSGLSAVYDTAGGAIIAFGGANGHDSVLRLASKGDADWELLPVSAGPGARSNALAVYDSSEQRLVIHGGVHDPRSARVILDDTWLLSLRGELIWTKLTERGEGPGARNREVGVYDPVGHRLIVFGGERNAEQLRDLHALSLGDEPEWSVLEPAGTAPELREPTAFYDGPRRRMLFASITRFGAVVAALELGEQPAWHAFCELGTAPPLDFVRAPVTITANELFATVNGAAYRFDLTTPYCD